MRDVRSTALRHAARGARNGHNVVLYSNGGELVLVLGATEKDGRISGQCHTRKVGSSGMARAVLGRFSQDLQTFDHLEPQSVLDASIQYAESAYRFARRRAGRPS